MEYENNDQKNNYFSSSLRHARDFALHYTSYLTGYRFTQIPRLKGNPFLGRLSYLLQSNGILQNLLAAGKLAEGNDSGMCYYWVGTKLVLLITKPEHVRQLLIENHQNISRVSSYKLFKIFIGSNITIDNHDLWKLKKEIYSDWLYKPEKLAKYQTKIMHLVEKYCGELKEQKAVSLEDFFNRYTIEVLLNTALLPQTPADSSVENLLQYHRYITSEVFEFKNMFKWMLPSWLRMMIFRKSSQDAETLKVKLRENLNQALLRPYQQQIKEDENFINSIYSLTDHQHQDELIKDPNVFGDTNFLLLAGQDTSLSSFQFTLKLLAAYPDIEKRLCEEIDKNLRGKPFTVENINKLQYLEMIIKESLRLYPPVPFLPRDVMSSIKIGDVELKKGDVVIFAPYLTHRMNTIWEQPEVFVPERFDGSSKIPHLAYIPFGVGEHMCIGQRFAWLEIKLILAAIYLNYIVEIKNNSFDLMLDRGALKPSELTQAFFRPYQ